MSPTTSTQSRPGLHKELRSLQFFAVAFGATIGVGWIVVLGDWLEAAGPGGTMLGFLVGGCIIAVIALCYAELATVFPSAGGEFVYSYALYGIKTSFVAGWLLAMAYLAVTAFETIAVGWIANALIPGLEGPVLFHGIGGSPVHLGTIFLGFGGLVLISALNYRGVGWASVFQEALTYGLTVAFLLFVGAGILLGDVANLKPAFHASGGGSVWLGTLGILIQTPNWLVGFNFVPQLMEEKAPDTPIRRVGLVMVSSVLSATLFYLLVVLACSMVTPWPTLVGMELPAAGAFEALLDSPILAKLVLLAGLMGLVTTWNAVFMGASRILFALGRARIIHPSFASVHPEFGTPGRAVLFVTAIGAVASLLGRDALVPLLNVVAAALSFLFILTCWGVVRLRRRRPEVQAAYRVPGGAVTGMVASAASVAFLVLALAQPYAAAGRRFPLEWGIILVGGVVGMALWRLGRETRDELSEDDRSRVVLGDESLW